MKRNDGILLTRAFVDTFMEMSNKGGASVAQSLMYAYLLYWDEGETPNESDSAYWIMKPYLAEIDRIKAHIQAKSDKARESVSKRKDRNTNVTQDDTNVTQDDTNVTQDDTNVTQDDTNVTKKLLINTIQYNKIKSNITTPPTPLKGGEVVGEVDFFEIDSVCKWLERSKCIKNDKALASAYVSFLDDRASEGKPIQHPASYFDTWYRKIYLTMQQSQEEQPPPPKYTAEQRERAFCLWCQMHERDESDPTSADAFLRETSAKGEYQVIGFFLGEREARTREERDFKHMIQASELVNELLTNN